MAGSPRERAGRGGHHGGEKVLAIGDPDYSGADKTAVSVYCGDEGLEAVPGTRPEAQAVGDVVLLGKEATVSRVREALASDPPSPQASADAAAPPRRWRAVHFACHGSVDPERPVL